VVLFTSHTDADLVAGATQSGVQAFLLKPLRPAELAPTIDLAIARFRETRELRQTLEGRKVIERAKGKLMERFHLTEDQAFRRLRRAAMDSRRPMVEVAKAVLMSESVASDVPLR
jgi:response regulator NasT